MNTIGWSISDWTSFHQQTTPNESLKTLTSLIESLNPNDPAWISISSIDNLNHQWKILQSKSNKSNLKLYGVPIAIKDNIDALGFPTTAACPSFSYNPENDSTIVSLLRDNGAIIIGKTNLDQFATGLVGTRSPYGITPCVFSDKHVSGGSSAGSASVVGRGLCPIAIGTDTAGSGRVPAALNNLIGLKPTVGALSTYGIVPACKSLDCPSIFALNLSDAQLIFNLTAKDDLINCEYSRILPNNLVKSYNKNLKIAIPIDMNGLWYGDNDNKEIYNTAIENFKKIGAEIVPADFTPLLDLAKCLYEGTWVAERYSAVKDFYKTSPPEKDLDPTVTKIIKGGANYDAATAYEFEYKRKSILNKVKLAFNDIDVLLVPTCPLNPTIEQVQNDPIKVNSIQGTWTNFCNLADFSALAIPVDFRKSDGLPNGVTIIGKAFEDYALLDLANRFFKQKYPSNDRSIGNIPTKSAGIKDDLISSIPSPNLSNSIQLAVVGAHLKGLPLHWQLEKVQATYLSTTKTNKNYKLYALPKTGPIAKPGLRRVEEGGDSIEIEIYAVPIENFGTFMAMVPEPLGIGSVETIDGKWVKSFICEEFGYLQNGTTDITKFGGWRNYLKDEESKKSSKSKPFNKVLVANRGEIAVRIMKTLKKLNIKSVAVYSDVDKYAEHVLIADEKIHLNGTSAAETYINIDKMLKAVLDSGAEAVIPGYGFLSENADFADKLIENGIVWVGPTGDAIRKLGLKHSAREIAENAGVPLVPGSGLVSTAKEAKEIAAKLEYPIMVKSTAGGGGIGLQKVDSEDDIERVFETVQHQGKSYFGDSGVFLERFVENSRHVEIQMFGDGFGNAIAIGERDCSLQRRNQKIIEETPAPNLPESTRQKMRKAAEQLASSMNYKCAGTVEFIYDEKRDEFYFLEVNTRLQVEHPITEMVTGLDLVEWMLYIAADMSPDFNQEIKVTGASMEARLYAENPVKDFKPSPGQLINVKFPDFARIDTWVKTGSVVSSEYDPTLAKIIVHGKDRAEALSKLRKALEETTVYGCITNVDYLKSVANSEMFENAKMHTKILDSYDYKPNAFEITAPGAYTTVQDYPGRVGHWRIGVPPSGPMDSYSHRLANRIVGNHYKAPAIEITLTGPSILFHHETVIAITGGEVPIKLNDELVNMYEPINIKRGDKLAIGKLTTGCRSYLAIRGGIDVTEYLGSRSTFALGNLGGYNGRVLKMGDVLFLNQSSSSSLPGPVSEPLAAPKELIPKISTNKEWTVGVTCGPHGSPDFFTEESIKDFFSNPWKVHYNSNRFGVRLIGPKPKWARKDGGEGGLHPSNAHDYVYSLGAINFTGDEPVILTCDGPSLGGFVCQAVVADAEMWKIGQVKPGDSITFVPITFDNALSLKENQNHVIESFKGEPINLTKGLIEPENPVLSVYQSNEHSPIVTYRQAGDRYILVEYGENIMDLNYSYRVHKLIEMVETHKTIGIIEMSQGVRSVLIEYNGFEIHQKTLVETLIAYESEVAFTNKWTVPSRVVKLPMAFEDKQTLDAVNRYQETIRSDAPWLPNNVDFIANINGIERSEVKDMLYSARFLVLGLGDVFLGAPCAVPLDPRHRFLGSKYNPSRTFTPNGTVGIGGMYMCIYTMESPGGYQLVGRTIPIWDKLSLGEYTKKFNNGKPWLLTPFDQVSFYPVSEEELEVMVEDSKYGKFEVDIIESVFDHTKYLSWIQANSESIENFQKTQDGEKLDEFKRLIQVANEELSKSGSKIEENVEEYPEDAEMVYSEFSGRFWKSLINVGDEVKEGQGLVVIEAMKTEMVVNSTKSGKVLKVLHTNGDMVDSGDLVVVIQ